MKSMEKERIEELVDKVEQDIRAICKKPAGMDVIERLLGMVMGQFRATVDLMPAEGSSPTVANPEPESIRVIAEARQLLCSQSLQLLDIAIRSNADLDLLAGFIAEMMPDGKQSTAPNQNMKQDGRGLQQMKSAQPDRGKLGFIQVQAIMEGQRMHSLCVDTDGHLHAIFEDCDVTLFGVRGFHVNTEDGSRAEKIVHGTFAEEGQAPDAAQ